MRYLLIGNYGVGNLGDEALKDYFLQTFPEVEWVVVCHGERSRTMTPMVPRLPFGLRSLFLTPWWRTVREYWKSDGVVFGGGSLFTDVESIQAPILWWWHAVFAWVLRKPIFLAFQGVGPLRTRLGTYVTRWVIRHAQFVSVRDHKSFERVRMWRKDVVESFDPVFCVILSIFSHHDIGGSEKTLVLIPRSNSDETFMRRVRELYAQGSFSNIRILSLQPSNIQEQTICNTIESKFPKCTRVLVHGYVELVREIRRASFVLSQRYHGALAALALGIPFDTVPQATDDKLMALKTISKEEALTLVEQGEKALRYALNV